MRAKVRSYRIRMSNPDRFHELSPEARDLIRAALAEHGYDLGDVTISVVARHDDEAQPVAAAARFANKSVGERIHRWERMPGREDDPTLERIVRRVVSLASDRGKTREEMAQWIYVIVWLRISKDDYNNSTSPRDQMELLARWCVEYGYMPVELHLEHAQTAWAGRIDDESDRPEFFALRDRIAADDVPANDVVCLVCDRFSRATPDASAILRLMARKKMSLHEMVDAPKGKLTASLIAEFERKFVTAQEQSGHTSERVNRTKQLRVEEGRLVHNYTSAYGYAIVWKERRGRGRVQERVVLDPEEAPWRRRWIDDALLGRPQRTIAAETHAAGHRMRPMRKAQGELTEGGLLRKETLRRILLSPINAGLQRLKGELYETDLIEKLCSRDEFEAICRAYGIDPKTGKRPADQQRQAAASDNGRGKYAGAKTGRCTTCGDRMHGSKVGDVRYLKCAKRAKHGRGGGARETEPHPMMRYDVYLPAVREVTIAFWELANADEAAAEYADVRAEGDAAAEQAHLLSRKELLRGELKRWQRLFALGPDAGGISEGEMLQETAPIREALHEIEHDLDQTIPTPAVKPGEDIRSLWEEAERRRDIGWIDGVLDRTYLAIDISPAPRRGHGTAHEFRLSFVFKPGLKMPREAHRRDPRTARARTPSNRRCRFQMVRGMRPRCRRADLQDALRRGARLDADRACPHSGACSDREGRRRLE